MEKLIEKYFPSLDPQQKELLTKMIPLYKEWNRKINVISRKDMDNIHIHHILHSMSIALHTHFQKGSTVLDVGTGGGFPGIPLSVLFPETHFYLCDSRSKKIHVVEEIAKQLGLDNVTAIHSRAEDIDMKFDFVVSRAVTELSNFIPWIWDKINLPENQRPTGIIYLKGGDLSDEIAKASTTCGIKPDKFSTVNISQWFEEDWFQSKHILFIKR
jgi:16S rRNA (guanine527-N7)-methyltransferase